MKIHRTMLWCMRWLPCLSSWESSLWKKGHVTNHNCWGTRITRTNLEARGMHDSSEDYPNNFSVPPSPQNPSFIHDKFLLYVGVTTRWYSLQNPRQTRAINKMNTDTNHHWSSTARCLLPHSSTRAVQPNTSLSYWTPPPPPHPESRNRVQCQCMTVATWLLRVLACRERILSWPFRKHGCLHTQDIQHTRDRFCSFAKHGCLHTHDVQHTRDRFWSFAKHGCLHTHDVQRARVLP